MAIETINNGAVTYQGSGSSAAYKTTDGASAAESPKGTAPVEENNSIKETITAESIQEQEREAIKKVIEQINKSSSNSYAQFGYHDETNRITIKIVDKDTKKIIKEYPPEETLDMIAKAWELAGLLVDERR